MYMTVALTRVIDDKMESNVSFFPFENLPSHIITPVAMHIYNICNVREYDYLLILCLVIPCCICIIQKGHMASNKETSKVLCSYMCVSLYSFWTAYSTIGITFFGSLVEE
ncbi:hypothetical protein XENTR_v10024503 [Xenopus tropicalis]|nr:hypothetical protein XENTR_v10024503 [Xenopus tropicalis]